MRNEILEKLSLALSEDIKREDQAVYILSRIRKVLEIENKKSEYEFLNFYCDWALHARLSKFESKKAVRALLNEFINGDEAGRFHKFDDFFREFKKFLKDHSLEFEFKPPEKYIRLLNLMIEIYSDTPLIFLTDSGDTRELVIQNNRIKSSDTVIGFSYTIKLK